MERERPGRGGDTGEAWHPKGQAMEVPQVARRASCRGVGYGSGGRATWRKGSQWKCSDASLTGPAGEEMKAIGRVGPWQSSDAKGSRNREATGGVFCFLFLFLYSRLKKR